MIDRIQLGSETAKGGFKNEEFVVEVFNSWETNKLASEWLIAMNYNLQEIEYVHAEKIKGSYKADVQVEIRISIKLKQLSDIQNLQVKLVSNPHGFNQIDKRWVDNYRELWDLPENIIKLLKHFTGELAPYCINPRDSRRMFADEFSTEDKEIILNFLKEKKTLIVSDILKGRGKFAAEWMLVILNIAGNSIKWSLKPMNYVLNYYGNGDVSITERGSFKIGRITIQRKGGDGGRLTANMLQFKINPAEIISE